MADNPNPSHHSNRWYRKHPEAQRPANAAAMLQASNQPPELQSSSSFLLVLKFIGFALIIGGFSLMTVPILYWYGVLMVWVGAAAVVWEVVKEPALIKRTWVLQIVLIGLCFLFLGWFTIRFPLTREEVAAQSYVIQGEYPPGTTLAGIQWDGHLTDLRVALIDPTDDDYHDVDMVIRPNTATYRAAILEGPANCALKKIPGGNASAIATARGGKPMVTWNSQLDEIHDDVGDVFTVLLTDSGYRLTCDKVPSHSNIQLVFAEGAVSPKFAPHERPAAGQKLMVLEEIAGATTPFALFGPKPSPTSVQVSGKYVQRMKPLQIDREIDAH